MQINRSLEIHKTSKKFKHHIKNAILTFLLQPHDNIRNKNVSKIGFQCCTLDFTSTQKLKFLCGEDTFKFIDKFKAIQKTHPLLLQIFWLVSGEILCVGFLRGRWFYCVSLAYLQLPCLHLVVS